MVLHSDRMFIERNPGLGKQISNISNCFLSPNSSWRGQFFAVMSAGKKAVARTTKRVSKPFLAFLQICRYAS